MIILIGALTEHAIFILPGTHRLPRLVTHLKIFPTLDCRRRLNTLTECIVLAKIRYFIVSFRLTFLAVSLLTLIFLFRFWLGYITALLKPSFQQLRARLHMFNYLIFKSDLQPFHVTHRSHQVSMPMRWRYLWPVIFIVLDAWVLIWLLLII
jgi:hypothetical protein